MGIKILHPGLLTTVQDGGRRGYMQFGITPAGVMDERSFLLANRLVGNCGDEAVLEITMQGPEIEFTSSAVFAVTGGDLQPRLGGEAIPLYRSVQAKAGDRLSFAGRKTGFRSYIAFGGGLNVPVVMGNRATDLRAGIGGLEGRKLQSGDELSFGAGSSAEAGKMFPQEDFSGSEKILRVIMGPQDEAFTAKGKETFLSTVYTVTPRSDRMGCRMDGAAVETVCGSDIITDGICMGAVQIPADGKPIIMMADRQTTGGYAKIANVIAVDLPIAAQLMPGDTVRFRAVSVQEAQKLLLEQQAYLTQELRSAAHRYRINLNGVIYHTEVERVE